MSRKRILIILLLIFPVIGFSNTAKAKSVYVVRDTGTYVGDDSYLHVYDIQDINLVSQIDYKTVNQPAIDLAIDIDSKYLFVTFENDNKIEVVNAKTMEYVDTVTATGASDLAGIVIDRGKQKVYTVDRRTPNLYVYSWYPRIPQLVLDEQIELEGLIYDDVGGAWGLALDEDNHRLWVTSNETKVRFYNTNDWSHDPNTNYITLSQQAVGIALDLSNQYVYTGTAWVEPYPTYYLSQYDLSDGSEATVDIGAYVLGISVDQQTSLVYLTTYGDSGDTPYPNPPRDRLMIYDCNLVKQPWESGDIGNPAGVAVAGDVSYKPSLFYIEKVDVNEPNCVVPGNYITYEITYGPNGVDHNNVVITDYLPDEVYFISASGPNMVYDIFTDTNIVTWQIGSLAANAPNDSVTLTVQVNNLAEPLGTITNYCEIEGDQYYTGFATVDTNVRCWGGDIIYADKSAFAGYNNGTSWDNAYIDLQSALDRAAAGCGSKIWVAEGTYQHKTSAFQLVDGVAIYGGFPTGGGIRDWLINETILDGGTYVVKAQDVNAATILDGLTIKSGLEGINLYSSSPKIINCKIQNNGYGIYCQSNSDPNIINCNIESNWEVGVYCDNSHPKITNCVIANNGEDSTDEYVSGIYCNNSSPTITNCIFSGNLAFGKEPKGGAMINGGDSSPVITNCFFTDNKAIYGGGMYNSDESSPTVINCTFRDNHARDGGGIYNASSSLTVTNCILWGNTATYSGPQIYNSSSGPCITYCDIQGGYEDGDEIIDEDPLFYDANSYHLTADSPCIDKGDPNFITNPDETDIDGEDRKIDGNDDGNPIVDIGADEYYWSPADFDEDEFVNFIDYAEFALFWWKDSDDPDYNDIYDLNDNNSIDYNDLDLFCEDWLWQAGWLKTFAAGMCSMGSGTGQSLGFTEGASLSAPAEQQQPIETVQLDIEELLKWLDELWLMPEVREVITEDEWLEFVESVKSSFE